jgi:hypothetical protein
MLKVGDKIGQLTITAIRGDVVTVQEADGTQRDIPMADVPALQQAEPAPAAEPKPANVSMREANDTSLNARMDAVRQACSKAYNQGPGDYTYIELVFDDYAILSKSGKLFKVRYILAKDGTVTFDGDPVAVRPPGAAAYKPVAEGGLVYHEGQVFGPLEDDGPAAGQVLEGTATPSGKKWGVLIIQEGLSKNRNRYQRKVLQEASPLYEGARIYLDHEEGQRRFGRSTKDVAGFLKDVQPVLMAADTKEAAAPPIFGLAAVAVITKPAVREELLDAWTEGKADLFGLSHDVLAESVTVMDPAGAFYDVTRIESVKSVDFVTNPAAGGRVLRLVASDTVPHSLQEDEAMLKKLIEAIMASGNAALIAKLEALGANPTDDAVLAIHQEALKTPAPAPKAEPTPTPQPKTEAAPATPAAPAGTVQVQEAEWLEVRRDGILSYIEATLAGCSLPDAVKEHLKGRYMAQVTEATTVAGLPTKTGITAAVKEQVELFGRLADQHVIVPAGGVITMGKGRTDKVQEAFDAFFGVKVEGKNDDGTDKVKILDRPSVQSFRSLYVDVTGDSGITGKVTEAVRLTEALQTSSFDQILGDSITRRMVAEYQQAPQAMWRGTIAEVVPVSDFRTQRRMRFGGYPNLSIVGEGQAYQALTSPSDEEATYAPAKRGGTEQLTLEMITNDDVGAIRRIPQRLARAASQTLYEFVFDFMRVNPLVYDGVALAASRSGGANISTTALSSTQITTLRNLMKKQADMNNGKRIGLAARYLWVPTDLEELAFQLTSSDKMLADSGLAAQAEPAALNFIRKIGIQPMVVDYWTDLNDYWLTADVRQTPMIEIGFLGGREEPELYVQDTPNQGSLFSNDQITYKIKHTYGGAVLDFRGFAGGIVT